MAYTVTWTLVAQHQLTDIWIESNRRREISEAADRIDVLLRNEPRDGWRVTKW